ncbi:TetR family transcriptional regulator [Longispora fulva]|uniref:AcrR family transcriptional regulator n=1 Tax=Longispora fulva TaxID=619741 RepID=A0A8J7GGR9_9ACTN|nr:TetR/AcrR family transcriptional regulator [Longispora fulva]MBG6138714.1 AcrR family transcriptional regulator [Longispora fulva]GIG58207.1 TetR family transcriptional regulator [Longispora fulva]
MDTRERIMVEALDLFAERGYGETSLREIAERIGITKAAVYYHFKTKDDILNGLLDTMGQQIDEIIAWGQTQPRTAETRQEVARRYAARIREGAKVMRFLHENQTALRGIDAGARFRERMGRLHDLFVGPDPDLAERLRGLAAIMTMHAGWMLREEHATSDDQMADTILEVALELVNGKP